jgi:hypothetical protein
MSNSARVRGPWIVGNCIERMTRLMQFQVAPDV